LRTFSKPLSLVIGALTSYLLTTAAAAPPIRHLPLPTFKKGIWATTHEVTVEGKTTKRYPDSLTDTCFDPAEPLNKGFLSAAKDGCDVELLSQTENVITYLSTCQGIEERSVVETTGPTDYKITTTSKFSRHVMTGHRVRDCATEKNLPLPDFRKGIWSVVTKEQRFDRTSPQESKHVLPLCDDPSAIVSNEITAAQRDGCDVQQVARNEYGASYGGPCSRPRPDGSKDFKLWVDSANPAEFSINYVFPKGMISTTGRWIKDCQAGDRVTRQSASK
jgi:hypothetical protein